MPLTFTIGPQDNIVYTIGEGSISLTDLREHMRTVNEDPRFKPGMDALADLRNSHIMMTLQDVPDLIRLFIQQAKTRKRGRWAVVIRRHPEAHLARFFITFMENLPFKMSVFGNTGQALHWLRSADGDRAKYA